MAIDLYEMGRALMEEGSLEQAAAIFAQSAATDPHFKTLELLGECYAKLNRFHDAVIPLAAAVTLNQQSRAPALLAEVFEKLGDCDRAIEMAKLAIARSADNKRARGVIERLA
jgi:tetratricopeptide (TPR) repeat protein